MSDFFHSKKIRNVTLFEEEGINVFFVELCLGKLSRNEHEIARKFNKRLKKNSRKQLLFIYHKT